MEQGRPAGDRGPALVAAAWSPPRDGSRPDLAYESRNVPSVMTPWELRDHVSFLMSELQEVGPQTAAAGQILVRLRNAWHALWARSGDDEAAWPEYAALLEEAWPALEAVGVGGDPAEERHVPRPLPAGAGVRVRAGRPLAGNGRGSARRAGPATRRPPAPAVKRGGDALFDRPIFIVSPPRSGSTLLFETLRGVARPRHRSAASRTP